MKGDNSEELIKEVLARFPEYDSDGNSFGISEESGDNRRMVGGVHISPEARRGMNDSSPMTGHPHELAEVLYPGFLGHGKEHDCRQNFKGQRVDGKLSVKTFFCVALLTAAFFGEQLSNKVKRRELVLQGVYANNASGLNYIIAL